jgi:hypothetical protein
LHITEQTFKILEKKISLLENQVKYYKTSQGLVANFVEEVEEVLEEDKINIQIKRDFFSNAFKLQEPSMQLSILYKENLI